MRSAVWWNSLRRLAVGLWALALGALAGGGVPAAAQEVVSGTVVDARSQRPLTGAEVVVQGTDLRDVTDNRGQFEIRNVPGGQLVLIVIRIGYRPISLTVAAGATGIRVPLTESVVALDEVVVTGTAGQQVARSIGNSVGTVDVEDLERIAPKENVADLLSGQVAGVRIVDTGGEVGTGGVTRIRGSSSLSISSTPLIYVDGVRVNNADNDAGVAFFSTRGASRLNDFNADEIERIEVIKGPAAATLYGTEASNGVIQIITKKGRQGRPTVNMHVKQGANWLPDPIDLFTNTFYQQGGLFSGGPIVEVDVLAEDKARGMEWFQTGYVQSYGADVSGGSGFVQFFMSADWDRDEGPVPYNWRNKLSGRGNLSYTPADIFQLDFNLGMVRSKTQSSSTQQPLSTAIIWSCPAPGCEPGSGLPSALDGPYRGYIAYLPEAYEDEIEGFEDVDRTTLSVSARHDPFSWLTHRLTVGGDFATNRTSALFRATGNLGNFFNNGLKQVQSERSAYLTLDYSATATVNATPHLRFATSGGVQFYRRQQETVFGQGERFPVAPLETISAGATTIAAEDFLENRTLGVFAQEQISWKDRIFLTGAVRGDDNSAFGRNFDFVVYPKLSFSWVLTDEPMLADNPVLSTLKLRAAWGKAGQQPDLFAALRTYEPAVGPAGASILTPENIGNPDLEPEVGRELEVGFDASVINERLGVEFTYFDQKTTNAIIRVPTVPSEGFPGFQFQNIGAVTNKGIELVLRASVLRTNQVGLDLNFTYSTSKNEVADLGGQPPVVQDAGTQYNVEGFPLGGIFLKRVISADIIQVPIGGNPVNLATNVMCEGGPVVPGTNFSRGGGAAVPCAEAPYVFWGQPVPEWEGSVSATLTLFRNLQLYGLVDYLGGRTLISGDIAAVHRFFLNSRAILERTDPILLGYEALGGEGLWQPGTIDGGFAKLRTISASYTFPERWARRVGASRLSLTLSAQNVATLWVGQRESFGHRQMDPEVQWFFGATEDQGAYNQEGWPQMRRFLASLRVTY